MKTPTSSHLSVTFLLLFSSFSWAASADNILDFVKCLRRVSPSISKVIYTPSNSSYTPILEFSIRNLRFSNSWDIPKPRVIVKPKYRSHIQNVLYCAKKNEVQIRTRSGGHDFEGLSYISPFPFVLLDLIDFRYINVDLKSSTAWVHTGATFGELYHAIYQKSSTLTFPGGIWTSVGVTGFLCGGGHGLLEREHGIGADSVLDALIIDVNGRILDRKSMGEDLFWAIRGGSCTSFGIILSWKLQLVSVPEVVTVFNISKTIEQNGTQLLHRWQYVAPYLPQDLALRAQINTVLSNASARPDKKTVNVRLFGLFLGGIDELLSLMQEKFSELGLARKHCSEVDWITTQMVNSNFDQYSKKLNPNDLLDRYFLNDSAFKGKSDFVRNHIPLKGFHGLFEKLFEINTGEGIIIFTPFGGILDEISASATPFPFRNGTMFMLFEEVVWTGNTEQMLKWSRDLHNYLTPYVSKNPRGAYVNYNDLDLGVNHPQGYTSIEEASSWGQSYFGVDNFNRLIQVKTKVDPDNFFRYEQSIPVMQSWLDI